MLKCSFVRWLGLGAATITLLQLGSCSIQNTAWLALAGLGGLFVLSQAQ